MRSVADIGNEDPKNYYIRPSLSLLYKYINFMDFMNKSVSDMGCMICTNTPLQCKRVMRNTTHF